MTDEKNEAEPSGASGGSLAWIPVTERLPDEYEHVLGWNRGWCRAAEVWRDSRGEWCCPTSIYLSVSRITHWMPLPATPHDAK